jgi:far upstream element-binding protein
MAANQDIQSILAALGMYPKLSASVDPANAVLPAQQPSGGLPQSQQQSQQPSQYQGYPGSLPQTSTPGSAGGYSLPQPTNSGSVDLSSIRPVNSGTVSLQEAIAKARGFAAEKGIAYENSGRESAGKSEVKISLDPLERQANHREGPPHDSRRGYRRSRSRSRSPGRRGDNYRDSYNPYRDERRDDRRGGYGRERSRSPGPRGRGVYSPTPGRGGAGYGRERERSPQHGRGGSSGGDDSETIVIDRHLVGLVIGRQGENLRRVEQDTGCRIQFLTGPESSGPHRHCRITGDPRARMDAKREINRIIDENGGNPIQETPGSRSASTTGTRPPKPSATNLREGENSIQIMVPDRTVGLIIGRGGETIRDLQERSGCHVNIVGENKSVNGLRPVNLIGTEAAAAKAKELIMEVVESDTKTMGNRDRSHDQFGAGGGGGSSGVGHDSGRITEHINVPSEAVGMIIGKGTSLF